METPALIPVAKKKLSSTSSTGQPRAWATAKFPYIRLRPGAKLLHYTHTARAARHRPVGNPGPSLSLYVVVSTGSFSLRTNWGTWKKLLKRERLVNHNGGEDGIVISI